MNIYRHIADKRTLEREYSPSSCVDNLQVLLDAYATKSAAVRASLPPVEHRYGASDAEVLDLFAAPARTDALRPLLIYIHGGYWQELSKNEHSFPAATLNRNGISYVAVDYGLAPRATLDEMVERCRRAVAWIAQHSTALGVDAAAIHISGCSAGAHLAAMTALADWLRYGLAASPIRSVILLSGVYDLRPLPLTYINDAVRMSPTDALRNSPLLLIDAAASGFPPALVAVGDNEPSEFKRQSSEFAEAIRRRGGVVQHHEAAGRNHFDLPFDLGDAGTPFGALTLQHMGLRQA
jgi:arylformamidase